MRASSLKYIGELGRATLIGLTLVVSTIRPARVPMPDLPPATVLATWTQLAQASAWSPRDSQGEAVFRGRIWILGGWTARNQPILQDVWSSPDGVEWRLECEQAPWSHGDLAMVAAFRDRLWVMGGWGGEGAGDATNETWSSGDGGHWVSEGNAPWAPRAAAAVAIHRDRLWLFGGTSHPKVPGSNFADIWSTVDGRTWERELEEAPWGARSYLQAAVLNDRIYVMGGGSYLPFYHAENDVWSSSDGREWRRETKNAPWLARIWFSAVSYGDYLWVIGGWSNHPYRNHNDVWRSQDGRHWERVGHIGPLWSPRHEHSVVVHQSSLFVLGGYGSPMRNDVWKLGEVVGPP